MSNDRGGIHVVRADDSGSWSYEHRRPRVPVLGIILLVLGVLVIIDRQAPGAVDLVVSGITFAFGVAFLAWWLRGGWGLYPGILLTTVSLPGILEQLGVLPHRNGYGTLLLGLALLLVAAVRLSDRRGIGWQGFLGAVLVVLGGVAVAGVSDVGSLVWAAALIALGIAVIVRR
jgi:hypothetical protein